ncbi:hypothetical protein CHUAL_008780 [Chamberlinius hualienensis]
MTKFILNYIMAIRPIVWMFRLYGLDIAPPPKISAFRRVIFEIIFIFHMCLSVHHLRKCEMRVVFHGSYAELFYSIFNVFFSIRAFVSKIFFRLALKDIVKIKIKIRDVISDLEDGCQSQLQYLLWICGFLASVYPLSSFINGIIGDVVKAPIQNNVMDNIYRFLTCPFTITWEQLPPTIFISLTAPFIIIFKCLIEKMRKLQFKSTSDYLKEFSKIIKMHRQTCELIHYIDRVFRKILTVWVIGQVSHSLIFGRSISEKGLSAIHVFLFAKHFSVLATQTIAIGMSNYWFLESLKEIQRRNVYINDNSLGKIMSEKMDLYVTNKLLSKPSVTIAGLFTIKIHTILSLSGFILTYLIVLYSY